MKITKATSNRHTVLNGPCVFFCLSLLLFANLPARADIETSKPDEPLFVTAALEQAQKQLVNGHADAALKIVEDLGASADAYFRVPLTKCLCLTTLGLYQEALDNADKADAIKPGDKTALYCRAVPLVQLGRDADAISVFQQILKIDPRYAPAYFYLGVIHNSQGRVDLAATEFTQAIYYVSPIDAWIKPYAKDYLAKLPGGAPAQSQPEPDQFNAPAQPTALHPPALKKDTTGVKQIPVTQQPQQPRQSTQLQPIQPSQPHKAPAQQPAGGTGGAGSVISMPAPGPMPGRPHLKRGGKPAIIGSPSDTAESAPTPSSPSGPSRPSSPFATDAPAAHNAPPQDYTATLEQLYTSGDLKKTESFIQQYIEQNPSEPRPYLDLAAVLQQDGDPAQALQYYEKADTLDPENPALLTDWGRCLEFADRADEGMEKYRLASEKNPKFAPARLNLGNALLDRKDYAAAAEAFNSALDADPSFMLFYYGLITAYVGLNDMRAAADVLEKHFGASPIDTASLPQTKSLTYTLISLVLSDPAATYNLARMLVDYGYLDDAATFFHLFAQTYPGKYPEAEDAARKFLTKHPAPEKQTP